MDTDGAHQANRSSPSCLNSGTQRTDFCHGLLVSSPSSAWRKSALSQPDRAQPHRELRPLPGGPHRAVDPPQEREHLCYRFARRHTSVPSWKYAAYFSRPLPRTDCAVRSPRRAATGSVLLISSVARSAYLCHALEGLDTSWGHDRLMRSRQGGRAARPGECIRGRWMLAERAVRHATGRNSIDVQANRRAAADFESIANSARSGRHELVTATMGTPLTKSSPPSVSMNDCDGWCARDTRGPRCDDSSREPHDTG